MKHIISERLSVIFLIKMLFFL